VCPVCRAAEREPGRLVVGTVARREGDDIVEGLLLCTSPACQREHPIIDGIPIIVADIQAFMSGQLAAIQRRDDLSPLILGLLSDCTGGNTDGDRARYQLSSYARSHYGDLDPDEPLDGQDGIQALMNRALELASAEPAGSWIDIGCSVGRTTHELARRTGELTLGVDLNFDMLRVARRAARTGVVRHPLRRLGVVYDRREFEADLGDRDNVDFWACDATALPFTDCTFDGALSLNVVDCIRGPLIHLMEMGRVLRAEHEAVITTPYDWAEVTTPVHTWIGGHSQRAESKGSSVVEMRRVLSDAVPPHVDSRLRLVREVTSHPWRVFVHERASMAYDVHVVAARKLADA
jgi:SAM-dependent methyltransferase/uncharacterized protein YbaR (Trm112 family)